MLGWSNGGIGVEIDIFSRSLPTKPMTARRATPGMRRRNLVLTVSGGFGGERWSRPWWLVPFLIWKSEFEIVACPPVSANGEALPRSLRYGPTKGIGPSVGMTARKRNPRAGRARPAPTRARVRSPGDTVDYAGAD